MNHWATKYIGLPYAPGGRDADKGLDCFGLLRLVYKQEQGIEIPDLPGIAEEHVLTIAKEIMLQTTSCWKEISSPKEGCMVAMSQRTVFHHVGVWTEANGGRVIHCWKAPVVAETIKSLKLKGVKVIKFFLYGIHH